MQTLQPSKLRSRHCGLGQKVACHVVRFQMLTFLAMTSPLLCEKDSVADRDSIDHFGRVQFQNRLRERHNKWLLPTLFPLDMEEFVGCCASSNDVRGALGQDVKTIEAGSLTLYL